MGSNPLFIVEFKELVESIRDDRKFHMVITNRVLYGGATHWTVRKEQQTRGLHQKWFKAEGLPLVAVQKMELAPFCSFLAVEAGIEICTDSVFLFNHHVNLISTAILSFKVQIPTGWSLIRIGFAQGSLLFTYTFWYWEEMVWDLKGFN